LKAGIGFEFTNQISDSTFSEIYLKACETGIRESLQNGVLAGYPCLDMSVELLEVEVHEDENNEISCKIASALAFREACLLAQPVLLQPMMQTEVVVPEDFLGEVMGDLNSKRAKIQKIEPKGALQVIQAHVALSDMFGYATTLRSLSQGRASSTMKFLNYEAMSQNETQKIITKIRGF